MENRKTPNKSYRIWWLSPISLYCFYLSLVICSYYIPEDTYITIYRTNKYIETKYLAYHFICFFFFLIGYLFSKNYVKENTTGSEPYKNNGVLWEKLTYLLYTMYVITFFSYLLWIMNFIQNNGISRILLLRNLSNMALILEDIHKNSSHISGLTTFTELGIVVISLSTFIIMKCDNRQITGRVKKLAYILVAMACVRAFLFSERLAAYEIIIPMAIVWLQSRDIRKHKTLVFLFPILCIGFVLSIFGLLEYQRSWMKHYNMLYDSYTAFTFERIMGYYANAINTECAFLSEIGFNMLPFRTCEWLWKIPFFSSLYAKITPTNVAAIYNSFLEEYVSTEFNNPGGLLAFVADFGYFFPIFYIIFGAMIGRLYFGFINRHLFCEIMYPCIYLALLELPRFFLLGQSRGLCIIIGGLLIYRTIHGVLNSSTPYQTTYTGSPNPSATLSSANQHTEMAQS